MSGYGKWGSWLWLSVWFFSTAGPRGVEGADQIRIQGDVLQITSEGQTLDVALRAPKFAVGDAVAVGGVAPREISGSLANGKRLKVDFPSIPIDNEAAIEVELLLSWSAGESVVRKSARFRLVDSATVRVLKEIELDRIAAGERPIWTHGSATTGARRLVILEGPQSHPVFLPGEFVGIEYPIAATRCEGDQIVLAHQPGLRMQPNTWYESRNAVYGRTPVGEEVRAFQRYIAAHRPAPTGLHVNYNSWWTSPVPYTERDILDLMHEFQTRLYQAHGLSLDTFCIDMGWSHLQSVWEIDGQQFPAGFARIRDAAHEMNASLGLWISPSSCYPGAVDNAWAQQQGYEAFSIPRHGGPSATVRYLCLGGPKYADRFRDALVELVSRWDIHHLKLDGCRLVCPVGDHGHEPGKYSSESIAAGLIAAVEAARRADPELWIETTCFGYNPSPWWLFYVNSVIGTYGDDAPVGRVPSPVQRESYTTARDYFNLQGAGAVTHSQRRSGSTGRRTSDE